MTVIVLGITRSGSACRTFGHHTIKIESSSDKRKRIITITNRGKAQMTKALLLWERAQGIIIEKFGKGN